MAENGKRTEIMHFIEQYIALHGYGPSIREIGEAVNLKSTATVHYHLQILSQAGLIQSGGGKKRTISLCNMKAKTEQNEQLHWNEPEMLMTLFSKSGQGLIPIVGTVAAGQPILAEEHVDGYLPWDGGAGCFALRVKGESMKNAGILPGDLVIVRPQPTAENGEIVVALLEDEATVKRLSRKDGHIWLLPENEAFSPIDGDEAAILGLVRGVVRMYD